MPISLLSTKLHIPPARSGLVSRTRLLNRMDEGLKGKLTLISAPAGFGKTTLLGEWIGSLGKPVAWLSLEKADNDPRRFWNYVLAALRIIQPGLGKNIFELQFTSSQSQIDDALTQLINEIADIPDPLLLILDDYHLIDSLSIQESMIFLLEHVPSQLHLVIASRADPPWPLAHWRSRDRLMEIRTADLRFTSQETADFLNHTMKLNLSAQDIAALEERTEGWIAGLQMAALSLQGRENVREFIEAFTGSNRYIFDYLVEEVLSRQPIEVQEFLLKTSILVRLSAPLCDAMLERTDSREILHKLERANLFLIPLDDERKWYRYHHLFSDLLSIRLRQIHDTSVLALYRRASFWYEKEQILSEAVKLALLGGDARQVSQIVEGHLLAVVSTSELSLLNQLLSSLPEETVNHNPWLTLAMAWGKAYLGDMNLIEPLLEKAALNIHGLEDATQDRIKARILVLRSYVAGSRRDHQTSIQLAREALDLISADDLSMRSFAILIIGNAYRFEGSLGQALDLHNQAFIQSEAAKDTFLSVMILSRLVDIHRTVGQLNRAHQTGMQALEMIGDYQKQTGGQSFILGYLKLRMSGVYYEQNEIELALQCAQVGLDLARQWGAYDSISLGYFHLAKTHMALGNITQALSYIRDFKEAYPSEHRMQYRFASAIEAGLYLQAGRLQEASEWMKSSGVSPSEPIHFLDFQCLDVFVQVLAAQNHLDEAQNLLERLLQSAQKFGAVEYEMLFLGRIAVILQKLGDEEASFKMLTRAIGLAAPEGYLRTFLDQGEPMAHLLYRAASRGINPEFCHRLLSVFSSTTKLTAIPQDDLIEHLSSREMEILQHLAGSLSTPEIAMELYISVGTVRTHIKNIYRKLNVNRRMQAVERAKEMGVI